MTDAEFRRKAWHLIVQCSQNGNLGHCIACGKFVDGGERHGAGCPVPELLAAGARERGDETCAN